MQNGQWVYPTSILCRLEISNPIAVAPQEALNGYSLEIPGHSRWTSRETNHSDTYQVGIAIGE
ncbi:hypothetical protein PM082_024887 [Marasmius tenuissimus]|nr:hypothetical protein PM082_024887 [Marasmius tenuissimus]